MEVIVTEEIIGRQSPEAQAIIRLLLARIAKLEAELEQLRRQVRGKTPQTSSPPPGHSIPTPSRSDGDGNPRSGAADNRVMQSTSDL